MCTHNRLSETTSELRLSVTWNRLHVIWKITYAVVWLDIDNYDFRHRRMSQPPMRTQRDLLRWRQFIHMFVCSRVHGTRLRNRYYWTYLHTNAYYSLSESMSVFSLNWQLTFYYSSRTNMYETCIHYCLMASVHCCQWQILTILICWSSGLFQYSQTIYH